MLHKRTHFHKEHTDRSARRSYTTVWICHTLFNFSRFSAFEPGRDSYEPRQNELSQSLNNKIVWCQKEVLDVIHRG